MKEPILTREWCLRCWSWLRYDRMVEGWPLKNRIQFQLWRDGSWDFGVCHSVGSWMFCCCFRAECAVFFVSICFKKAAMLSIKLLLTWLSSESIRDLFWLHELLAYHLKYWLVLISSVSEPLLAILQVLAVWHWVRRICGFPLDCYKASRNEITHTCACLAIVLSSGSGFTARWRRSVIISMRSTPGWLS